MSNMGLWIRRGLIAISAACVLWAFLTVGFQTAASLSDSKATTQISILYWGDNRERDIVLQLVSEFEAANPGIEVLPIHSSDYDAKLMTMFAAGDPPDAFYVPYERLLGQFVESGQLENLESYIAQEQATNPEWLDDFYPELINAFRWDPKSHRNGSGDLYGLPKDFTTTVMYANLDLLRIAGVEIPTESWTWDDYTQAVQQISAINDSGAFDQKKYGGVLQTFDWVLLNFVWTFGGDFFGTDFEDVTLDDPAVLEAFQYIVDRRKEGSVYNATGISQAEDELFRLGHVGFIGPLGRWKVPTLRKVDFDWDVLPLPSKEGVDPVNAIATVSWSMSSISPHKAETWELMKFLCGPRGQELTAQLGIAIPALRSVAESDSFLAPQQKPASAQVFLDQIASSKYVNWPAGQEFKQFVDEEIKAKALSNLDTPVADAAQSVIQRWDRLLTSPLQGPGLKPMPWKLVTLIAITLLGLAFATLFLISRKQKIGKLDSAAERTGWMFISPWILGFLIFVLGPMVMSLILGFTKWSATTPLAEAKFVGLGNFTQILTGDQSFIQSIKVTLYYTVLAVPITQIVAILVALLMNLGVRGIALFRTMYFVPSVVSGVALVVLWITIFDNSNGVLNEMILAPILKPMGLTPPDWFGMSSKWFASPALVIMTLWGVGGGMIIYLAGLKNVPLSLYEAACLDGAGAIKRFFSVTLPMISPIVFFQVIMSIIMSFQIFTQAFVIRGASGGTNPDLLFYVLNLYDQAFKYHNMGYASALAWLLFLAILTLTLIVFKGAKGMVHYEGLK